MSTNENDFIESTDDTEETVNNEEIEINLDDEVTENEDDVEDLKKQIQTLQAQKDHWRTKATKVAEAPKETKSEDKSNSNLSTKDLYALMENKVSEEDIDEVVEYAQLKKISVSEALKSSVVKTILSEKAEQRNVALATNTGKTKAGSSKISDDVLLSKAMKGELPESPEDIARLTRIRRGLN